MDFAIERIADEICLTLWQREVISHQLLFARAEVIESGA
jgi:hypothetical protein